MKKDPVSSYARNAGIAAARSGVTPYAVPGKYITNTSGGGEPVVSTAGPEARQVPGAYVSNVKNGATPGEQGIGDSSSASQPETGEKGSTGASGEYPMSKNAAWDAGVNEGIAMAAVDIGII